MYRSSIGLDFETYAATDLKKHGLERYVTCPTFTVLIASIALPEGGAVRIDVVNSDSGEARERLIDLIADRNIIAHNVGFEYRVLKRLGIDIPIERFHDSAVAARADGAGSSLEAAAPQLLGWDKLDPGSHLLKLFCTPGEYQERNGSPYFDARVVRDNQAKWEEFGMYCDRDAELALMLWRAFLPSENEIKYSQITLAMNNVGWHVDLDLVKEMQRRYELNQANALAEFRQMHEAEELNLNSLKQLKEWCNERGIKASSFDEKHVEKLSEKIRSKLETMDATDARYDDYFAVLDLLRTKQILGGSSLKKLQVILDTTGPDSRLRDQYIHVGASQSFRTTGRSVQMQNLKRLAVPAQVEELLEDPESEWDNTELANNLRQVFTSSHPQGRLIVGDFSSVESRGLAWQAGADWKTDAFRSGKDLYKVQAALIFGTDYYAVTKEQRQVGKVGELSCGYQAGPDAVRAFAENMGVALTEVEAATLVRDWRTANPEIVRYWEELDEMLGVLMASNMQKHVPIGPPESGYRVIADLVTAPKSLIDQSGHTKSLVVEVFSPHDETIRFSRVFHGIHTKGRELCYFKPSERKTGDLWRDTFVDPKTKRIRNYTIYGGKLAGILTQSLCREVFFWCLANVHAWCKESPNVELIGQFHDEIVLDWVPPSAPDDKSLELTEARLERFMSDSPLPHFPLAAEVKSDYRYTK